MSFRPPAGATIRDFVLNRQVYYYNPVIDGSGTAPPYILYSWGGVQFAGAGEYDAATRDAINATGHWYGYPSGALDTGAQVVTKATFGRLAGLAGRGLADDRRRLLDHRVLAALRRQRVHRALRRAGHRGRRKPPDGQRRQRGRPVRSRLARRRRGRDLQRRRQRRHPPRRAARRHATPPAPAWSGARSSAATSRGRGPAPTSAAARSPPASGCPPARARSRCG